MKFAMLVVLSIFVSNAQARDTRNLYSYEEAMASAEAKSKLGNDIKFFFGDQKTPPIAEDLGEAASNKKTNAFNKSDKEACHWAFLSAMVSLKEKAVSLGADAVVNIRSNYKNKIINSATEFECGAGALMAGTALKGKIVKLKK